MAPKIINPDGEEQDFMEYVKNIEVEYAWWEHIWWPIHRRYRDTRAWVRDTWHLIRHGYRRSDTWSLDYSLAKWVLPRLKHLRKHGHGYPADMTPEEWDAKLGIMVEAFEMVASGDAFHLHDDQIETVEAGLRLFAKHYLDLWD